MIGPEDLYDSEKYANDILKLEEIIDMRLKEQYTRDDEIIWTLIHGRYYKQAIQETIKNYKQNGWKVWWDGACDSPEFSLKKANCKDSPFKEVLQGISIGLTIFSFIIAASWLLGH